MSSMYQLGMENAATRKEFTWLQVSLVEYTIIEKTARMADPSQPNRTRFFCTFFCYIANQLVNLIGRRNDLDTFSEGIIS